MKLAPNQVILHCRTNNQRTKEEPKSIANNIINLAKNIKTSKVAVSGLIPPRIDTFNQKVKQLNENPRNLCEKENTIHFAS